MTKPHLLIFETYDDWDLTPLKAAYTLHQMPDHGTGADVPAETRDLVTAFAFKGHSHLTADIMDAFPNLEMIANYGVGYDTIDVEHAKSKGIKVTNTPEVLTDDVADLAVGLLIAGSRDMVGASDWVRSGNWAKSAYPVQRKVTEKKVGIVGLGRIGRAVADRLAAFRMDIHYYARSAKETPGWTHHTDITAMAAGVDYLVVALSGGPETKGMVGADAINALGPEGQFINISRGTTIDENALLTALETGAIRSAALDVFENEPNIDPRFMALSNVLLSPHQSSGTIETRKAIGRLQRDNLAAFFAGKPLLTPVY